MEYGFGIDVGGSVVKSGFFDVSGKLLDRWDTPTDTSDGGARILPAIAGQVESCLQKNAVTPEAVAGIGIGVPGPVDARGNVSKCVNLGWGAFNIERELSSLTGLNVRAANDANAAALGEMWKGAGRGHETLLMVTLGTGVGGGVIAGGGIMPGENGSAGEIGHFTVNTGEQARCACGKYGCLEQYVSGRAIAAAARSRLIAYDGASLLRDYAQPTAKEVFACAKKGDALSLGIAEDFGDMLGMALANAAALLDPEIIIIGGGVSRAGEYILDYIRRGFDRYAFHAVADTPVVLARLGGDAGIYGCFKILI